MSEPSLAGNTRALTQVQRRPLAELVRVFPVIDQVADRFGGLTDLPAGLIRTPGAAERSFGDDPLRMLRAARFAAQLGFAVDPAARAAIVAMAGDLARITAERIRDEFTKLLTAAVDPV